MQKIVSIFNREFQPSVFGGYGDADFEVATAPLMYFNGEGEWHHSSKVAVVRTDTMEELGSRHCCLLREVLCHLGPPGRACSVTPSRYCGTDSGPSFQFPRRFRKRGK